jgi:hypothetical protein
MNRFRYYLPGISLILIAFLIVAVPQILVAFVAAIIIMAGILALYLGHLMKKSEVAFRDAGRWFSEDDVFGRHFRNGHLFKRFQRPDL